MNAQHLSATDSLVARNLCTSATFPRNFKILLQQIGDSLIPRSYSVRENLQKILYLHFPRQKITRSERVRLKFSDMRSFSMRKEDLRMFWIALCSIMRSYLFLIFCQRCAPSESAITRLTQLLHLRSFSAEASMYYGRSGSAPLAYIFGEQRK